MITIYQIQKRLIKAIKESGLKQKEIADKLGIAQQTISAYLNNDKYPSIDTLANLCKILDISADEILCLDEDNEILMTKETSNTHGSNNIIKGDNNIMRITTK